MLRGQSLPTHQAVKGLPSSMKGLSSTHNWSGLACRLVYPVALQRLHISTQGLELLRVRHVPVIFDIHSFECNHKQPAADLFVHCHLWHQFDSPAAWLSGRALRRWVAAGCCSLAAAARDCGGSV